MKVNKAGLHYGILIIVILIAVYMGMEWYKKEEGASVGWEGMWACSNPVSVTQKEKCLNSKMGLALS